MVFSAIITGIATITCAFVFAGMAIYTFTQREDPYKTSSRERRSDSQWQLNWQAELKEIQRRLAELDEEDKRKQRIKAPESVKSDYFQRKQRIKAPESVKSDDFQRKHRYEAPESVKSDVFHDALSNLDDCDRISSVNEESYSEDSSEAKLEAKLVNIDKKLNDPKTIEDVTVALEELEYLCFDYHNNVELLYRIGQARSMIADYPSEDKGFIQEMLDKGIQACISALTCAPEHGDVHKWYAVLLGSKAENCTKIKERIKNGALFKDHLDKAMRIKPEDYQLLFLFGMFKFEIARMSWFVRNVAEAVLGELPTGTYEEADTYFLKAETMAPFACKENRMMIGKCKIALSQYKEGVQWLKKALNGRSVRLGHNPDAEINKLLEEYGSY